jgi:hypothetical protein
MKYMFSKTMVLAGLLAISGAASAQTINLNPAAGFGNLHQYHGVTTDAVPADPVTFYVSSMLWAQFASEADTSGLGVGDNWHWSGAYAGSGNPSTLVRYFCSGPLYDAGGYYTQVCTLTGEQMVVSITESVRYYHPKICSGRGGCYTRTYWSLLGGWMVR